jgi:hypothetical protein
MEAHSQAVTVVSPEGHLGLLDRALTGQAAWQHKLLLASTGSGGSRALALLSTHAQVASQQLQANRRPLFTIEANRTAGW